MSQRSARVRRSSVALAATVVAALALAIVSAPAAHAAPAQVAYALSGTNLVSFDPATPATTQTTPITGVAAGDTLVGIDVRPQNGMLYTLGVNATTNTATLYALGRTTGFASVVGPGAGAIAFVSFGNPVDFPDPATAGYGIDFNPAVDRVRVVAGALNFRADPNSGLPVDSDGNGANGNTPDGVTNGSTASVDAAAYTNNRPNNGAVTTLYTLDAVSDSLFIQSPPNAATQLLVQAITLDGSPLQFAAVTGFDIDPAVNAPASNAPVAAGSAYAVLSVGGTTGLYSINLVNGVATFLGNVGNGVTAIQGLALQRDFDDAGFPVVSLDAGGSNIVRFASATPGTTTTQALDLGPVSAGEMLVAIALRPQTGQYVALGVSANANTASLYRLDPQTGTLTAVTSLLGAIAWVLGDGATPVDLPDPVTAAYGLDFNPAADRLRVVTSTGINARINPNNGTAVDGNLNSGTPPGTNTDAPINGAGVTGAGATSYTNAFTQPLAGGVTTQYTIDPVTDSLYVQNLPNAGTQTLGLPLTLGGVPVNVDTYSDFDIPGDVAVTTSNTPAKGEAVAALRVAGATGLYRLNLASGALASLGTTITNLRSIAVGDARRDLPVLTRAPASLPFGERETDDGASATLASTVTNPGSTAVTLTSVAVGGADAGEFALLSGNPADCAIGTELATTQTCQLRARFDPASTGAKTASVTVASNAPSIAIALSGTGTNPTVTPPPPPPPAVVPPPPPIVVPPPPPLTTEPTITRVRAPRLLGKPLSTGLVLGCPAASKASCAGSVRVTRRSLRPGSTATVRVASATFSVAPGTARMLRARPPLAVRRLLRHTERISLTITVVTTNSLGQQRTRRFSAVIARQPG